MDLSLFFFNPLPYRAEPSSCLEKWTLNLMVKETCQNDKLPNYELPYKRHFKIIINRC
jgi:hypothetical protein